MKSIKVPHIFQRILVSLLLFPQLAAGQVDFPMGSTFFYLKGLDAQSLDAQWMNPSFDDGAWSQGVAPFRYGDGAGGTVLGDMQMSYTTLYLRTSFTASGVDQLDDLRLLCDYDDGFVVWINGSRVLSVNAPQVLSHDARASDLRESGTIVGFELDPVNYVLVEGENTLAIQAFNYSLESSDFYMDLSLQAELMEPMLEDTVGLSFSMPSGFYEEAFELQIFPSNPSWKVVYTLDGSNPQDSETAVESQGGSHGPDQSHQQHRQAPDTGRDGPGFCRHRGSETCVFGKQDLHLPGPGIEPESPGRRLAYLQHQWSDH